MKLKEKIKNNFLYRLLAFNLILVVLITIIPQMVSFQYTRSIFDKEIDNINSQTVNQIRSVIDDDVLKDIVNLPVMYLTPGVGNSALTYPIDNDIHNDPIAKIEVIRKITAIQANLPYIDSISLYYKKYNVICTGYNIKYLNDPEYPDFTTPVWLGEFLKNDNNINWLFYVNPESQEKVMSYVRAMPLLVTKANAEVIVAVNIDIEKLNDVLKGYKPEDNGSLFIVNGKGEAISSNLTAKQDLNGHEISKIAMSIPQDVQNGKMKFEFGGKASMVSFYKSQYNDWQYISVLPMGEYYKKYSVLRFIVFITIAVFLLVNILFMILLTRKAHTPIGSEITGLRQKLDKNIPIIRHNLILSLFSTLGNDTKNLEEQAKVVDIELDERPFFCFTLIINFMEPKSTQEIMLLTVQLLENLNCKNKFCELWSINDERGYISGIFKFSHDINKTEALGLLTDKIEEIVGLNYKLGVGTICSNMAVQARESYEEACEAFKFFFIRPKSTMILYGDLDIDTLNECDKYVLPVNEIESSLRAGEEKRLKHVIDRAVQEILNGKYDVEYCKNLLLDIVVTMHVTAKAMGYSSNGLFECDIRQEYKNISNVEEFQEWMGRIIQIAVGKINEQRSNVNIIMGNKIKEYIVSHLYDDLTLESLAEHIGVTPTYLSKIFKLYIGATYTEYVTEMKMHQAGIMVREKKMTVKEIAEKLGYNSTHHFIRLFKVKYGVTPKQYQLYKAE